MNIGIDIGGGVAKAGDYLLDKINGLLSRYKLGDVSIGEGSSIWYGSVARGDMNYVKIGKFTNIQDNATVHVDTGRPCIIGDYTTVGHNAIIHGCRVGNNCLIGMGTPGKVRRQVDEEVVETIRQNAMTYEKMWKEHI